MEVIDTIEAWQIEPEDLCQFEAYDDEGERYIELLKVKTVGLTLEADAVVLIGESLVDGSDMHTVDYYLEVELMGA